MCSRDGAADSIARAPPPRVVVQMGLVLFLVLRSVWRILGIENALDSFLHGSGGGECSADALDTLQLRLGGYDPESMFAMWTFFALGICDLQVRADVEDAPHSKRSAALSSRALKLSFRYGMDQSLVRTISKGERRTRPNDCHSSL